MPLGRTCIYWVDDKPQSVRSLSMALGIQPVPDHIVAFFSEAVEKEFLEKELQAFNGKEDTAAALHRSEGFDVKGD
jgi:hypothetical protein